MTKQLSVRPAGRIFSLRHGKELIKAAGTKVESGKKISTKLSDVIKNKPTNAILQLTESQQSSKPLLAEKKYV